MNEHDSQQEHSRRLCTPRRPSELADRQRFIELFKQRNPIPLWRWILSKQRPISTLIPGPGPGPQPSQRLLDMGISLKLLGFPVLVGFNFVETDLANYDQIVDAFSHCFYPGLFAALNQPIPDPYAAWPYQDTYWDGLFKLLSPNGFEVQVENSNGRICLGVVGDVVVSTGIPPVMQIYDCTGAGDIFHEIGHVVMDHGIRGRVPPLYYNYASSSPRDPSQPPVVIDAIEQLDQLFGNYSEKRIDTDGLQYGFVSDYARMDQREDFAETFKYYVYFPDDAGPRAARQQLNDSTLLGKKLEYISYLFKGMTFGSGGAPGSWPGYPLD